MIDYTFLGQGLETGEVWSLSWLNPLAPRALTPFTNSLLVEVAARAWYLYFDRLGFQPAPRSRLVRLCQGRPYVNLSISARLEAEQAGIEPLRLRLDGAARPLADWHKPGLLASLKRGRADKKIEDLLAALQSELPGTTARAQGWYQRVMALRWSQAEVLQIMEEIERAGAAALLPFFAARHTLDVACRRLLLAQREGTPQQRAARLAVALGGSARTVELDLANRVAALGREAAADPAALAWLRGPVDANWQRSLPAGAFGEAFEQFMALYGQRAIGEGEIAVPRWREDPATLVAALRAAAADERSAAPPLPADPAPLLAAVDSSQRKETLHLLERMRRAIELQSGGLHAFAFVLAGTRRWALAAGREATVDQRLLASEDVFFYELEEVKQMMTGEWNISDRSGIHATAGERRVQLAQAQQVVPADLLWGEREARRDPAVLPAAAGVASGMAADEVPSPGCVWGCPVGESAAAVLLPASAALLIAQGSLIDPLADCARALGRPAVVGAHLPGQGAAAGLSVDGNVGRVSSR